MKPLALDKSYVLDILGRLLNTPSPSGFTDRVVALVCEELDRLQVPFELTRRGAVRATLQGERRTPDRALAAHLDTLGAMVKELKPNGRLRIAPVGHWNARFAEGARVTVFTDGGESFRGSILPMKASGHTFGPEIDDQPCSWEHVEVRVDARFENADDLRQAGIQVGDFIAVDTNLEINDNGYINSRHLDDKAGVAVLLGTVQAVQAAKRDNGLTLPVDCHVIFTITEEVGAGASAVLPPSVAEMVSVDNGTNAPGQNSREFGATLAMADMTGPFDYHLTRHLQRLCETHSIDFQRDVFRYYRSDNATALEAGNDVRTALVCFGIDASHGYERIHWNALESLIALLGAYVQTPPLNPAGA
ncbi:MAG: osmoprotectant NAGGN system M42 family peptidase [Acidihalobacter sp.]